MQTGVVESGGRGRGGILERLGGAGEADVPLVEIRLVSKARGEEFGRSLAQL